MIMNKNLEALNKMIEKYDWVGKEYCRLIGKNESLHKVNQEAFENLADTIKQDLESYEQLKQDHDKTLINNGELCVKVAELEKEYQKLKKDYDLLDTTMESDDRIIYKLFEKRKQLEKENQELKQKLKEMLENE